MTTRMTGYTGTDGTLPRLCIKNEVTASTISTSTSATDHAAVAVVGPQTYTSWSPTALPAWVQALFVLSSEAQIDYVSARISDGNGCAFKPQYWTGAAWVDLGTAVTVAAGSAETLLWLFDVKSTDRVRLYVTGSTAPFVANLKAGIATVMPIGLQPGYAPSSLNPTDEYANTISEGGQILGSALKRSTAIEQLQFQPLSPAWVRANWPTIRDLLRTEAVVFAWRPSAYPDEVIYGMVTGKPAATYVSHVRMSVSLTIEGPS